jgi:proteasome lid subunit RPN8/RPN11
VQLGAPAQVRREFPDHLDPDKFVLAGDYHTHPSKSRRPSKPDLEAWAVRRSDAPFASIIVTSSAVGQPELHGWVTYEDGGRLGCDPAIVVSSWS